MKFRLACSSKNGLKIYEFDQSNKSHNLIYELHSLNVRSIFWSPDNTCLAALQNEKLQFVHFETEIQLENVNLPPNMEASCIAFGFKAGRMLYLGGDGISVYDRKDKKFSVILETPARVEAICVSADDSRIACGLSTGDVFIHSLKHNTSTKISTTVSGPITAISFYPFKKNILAYGGQCGTVSMCDLNTSKSIVEKKQCHSSPVRDLAFAPCNKHFYCTVATDRKIIFHDIQSSKLPGVLQIFESEAPLFSLSINDEHTVAMGDSKGNVKIYDLRSKSIFHTIDTGLNGIENLYFQPPKWAITASINERIPVSMGSQPEFFSQSKATKSHLDIFSPVGGKRPVQNLELRRQAVQGRLQERLKFARSKSESDFGIREIEKSSQLPKLEEEAIALAAETPQAPSRSEIITPISMPTKEEVKQLVITETKEKLQNFGSNENTTMAPETSLKSKDLGFQHKIIKSIVEEAIENHYEQLHEEIQNIHIDLIRQFEIQKRELKQLLKETIPNKELMNMIKSLRDENDRLRSTY